MAYKTPIWVDCVVQETSPANYFIHYAHTAAGVPLAPIQYGWHQTPARYSYGPIIRDHFLLHFISKGRGRVVVNNRQYPVGPNQCFAIFPHQITFYEADPEDPWVYHWLGFDGDWAQTMMDKVGFSDTHIVVDIPHAREVFGQLNAIAPQMQTEDFYLYLTGQLHNTLYFLGQHTTDPAPLRYDEMPAPEGNEYVRILLSIIKTSFAERISIQALASRLGLNRSYMTKLFHQHTGSSIKAYLHEYRLQWSLLLLQEPDASIKSIALESGFQDQLYFSRAFHARFGLSPQQYRNAAQHEQA